ncbi:hypothetical protein [Hymenobacter sp. GOD-10R]|uniref:hypothetical protein n=1 Tax=Hymenobacter sp. GOD-10R TaxID=3093922 RepID=UPI002D7829E6|nr:hypothetical protein [Hymenobacter sp. GOD-10R]WRQ31604.1 hypothetical protein SD425_27620 [Hymenobacter sp. GOD-10R]
MNDTFPKTFSELLREGNQFTDRDFMKVLAMGHPKLKSREADPSLFTVGELMLLAKLINTPIKQVMTVVLDQIARDTDAEQKREQAVEQAVGRKYYPRKLKSSG